MIENSVVVLVWKRDTYLMEAINSVLNQTKQADEILIVGTLENTEMIQKLKKNNKIILHLFDENQYKSVFEKVMYAMTLAKGKNVFFLEDDDLFDEHKIKFINKFTDKNYDIIKNDYINFHFDNVPEIYNPDLNFQKQEIITKNTNPFYIFQNKLWHNISTYIINRENYFKNTQKFESFFKICLENKMKIEGDISLFLYGIEEGNIFKFLPKMYLTYYRIHNNNVSFVNKTSFGKKKSKENEIKRCNEIIYNYQKVIDFQRKHHLKLNNLQELFFERDIIFYKIWVSLYKNDQKMLKENLKNFKKFKKFQNLFENLKISLFSFLLLHRLQKIKDMIFDNFMK